MLTARASQDARVLGLDIGADDYLVKPFHFPELMARVRAILRRKGDIRRVILRIDDVVLDPNALSVYVGENRLVLTAKEFAILEYLVRNAGCVISQEELLEHVWNEDANLFTQTIKVHINNLRNKLKSQGKIISSAPLRARVILLGSKRMKIPAFMKTIRFRLTIGYMLLFLLLILAMAAGINMALWHYNMDSRRQLPITLPISRYGVKLTRAMSAGLWKMSVFTQG